jgi:hypothetical protein
MLQQSQLLAGAAVCDASARLNTVPQVQQLALPAPQASSGQQKQRPLVFGLHAAAAFAAP